MKINRNVGKFFSYCQKNITLKIILWNFFFEKSKFLINLNVSEHLIFILRGSFKMKFIFNSQGFRRMTDDRVPYLCPPYI